MVDLLWRSGGGGGTGRMRRRVTKVIGRQERRKQCTRHTSAVIDKSEASTC